MIKNRDSRHLECLEQRDTFPLANGQSAWSWVQFFSTLLYFLCQVEVLIFALIYVVCICERCVLAEAGFMPKSCSASYVRKSFPFLGRVGGESLLKIRLMCVAKIYIKKRKPNKFLFWNVFYLDAVTTKEANSIELTRCFIIPYDLISDSLAQCSSSVHFKTQPTDYTHKHRITIVGNNNEHVNIKVIQVVPAYNRLFYPELIPVCWRTISQHGMETCAVDFDDTTHKVRQSECYHKRDFFPKFQGLASICIYKMYTLRNRCNIFQQEKKVRKGRPRFVVPPFSSNIASYLRPFNHHNLDRIDQIVFNSRDSWWMPRVPCFLPQAGSAFIL